ncbi:hypothetical protein F4861DRAFT_65068 [Xylaria intraflava]|nr:hypothetical protein F4861DRAFT_65068 [Xylaria intraflava]
MSILPIISSQLTGPPPWVGEDDDANCEPLWADGCQNAGFIIDYSKHFYDIRCDAVEYRMQCSYYRGKIADLHHDRLTKLIRFAALLQNTFLGEVERELGE